MASLKEAGIEYPFAPLEQQRDIYRSELAVAQERIRGLRSAIQKRLNECPKCGGNGSYLWPKTYANPTDMERVECSQCEDLRMALRTYAEGEENGK